MLLFLVMKKALKPSKTFYDLNVIRKACQGLRRILTVLGINKCEMRGKDIIKWETYESEFFRRAKQHKICLITEVKNYTCRGVSEGNVFSLFHETVKFL